MLKSYLLTLLAIMGFGVFHVVVAQDVIITFAEDTIHCRINRVTRRSIHFTQFQKEIQTQSVINRNDVRLWQRVHAAQDQGAFTLHDSPESKLRFSLTSGGGYRVASTKEARNLMIREGVVSNEIDSYFRQIRMGYKVAGQVHYLFNDLYGLGIDYQYHNSAATFHRTLDPQDGVTLYYGEFSENVHTNYLGLSFLMQHYLNRGFKVYGLVSSGLTFYRNENVVLTFPSLITGNAYGGNTEIGIEYFICRKVALALSAGFFQSTISQIKVTDGNTTQDVTLEDGMKEGLSRIDLGAGLKFYL